MRKTLLLILFSINLGLFSQAPKLINYQGVARNSSGVALSGITVTITIDITSGTFVEKHIVNTNSVGIFTLHIGGGSTVSGSFAAINWGGGINTIDVTINTGSGPQAMGQQQLVSVPYALYAEKAGIAGSGSGSVPIFNVNSPNSVTSNTTSNTHTISIAQPTITGSGATTVTALGGLNYLVLTPYTTASLSGNILTLSPGGDTTNLSSLANGPWVKSGGAVYLPVITDNVGIGTISPGSNKLSIASSTNNINDVNIVSSGTGDGIFITKASATGNGVTTWLPAFATGTAINIANNGAGPGIYIDNGGNNAIHAKSTGSIATVFAENWNGSGPAVRGTKQFTQGNAGLFDITLTTSNSSALIGSTLGSGAAVHAMAGPAANSTLSLLVENGHIKTIGPSIASTSITQSGGFAIPSIAPIFISANDVKGVFSFTTTASGISSGSYIDVQLNFAKNYASPPTVVASPMLDMQGLDYMVTNVTATWFSIRVYKSSNGAVSFPVNIPNPTTFKFSYIVIE